MYNTSGKLKYFGDRKYDYNYFWAKNVYLCMHSADRDVYLEEISELFTRESNRLFVWAHEDNDFKLSSEETDTYFEDLQKYEVFVVFVSENFFNGEDICLYELKYALAKGMKILPLMQTKDNELINKINCLTGGIQALYPYDDDKTAIPFDDKFINYLEEIMGLDTELIKNINDNFDATIFISYRKKDRKYIKPLMQAIHSMKELDNVGIWYDESEKAGEEFEQQIWDAFGNANMGILLISGNTLEEGNYVAAKEYPFICEKKIPFIPVVVDDTDIAATSEFLIREAQKNSFSVDPLPKAIRLSDDVQIATEVFGIMNSQGVLSTGLSNYPQKCYYLGLAYQTHTLQPFDIDKAFEYLSKAADGGCTDAFERMVYIYEHGIGIPASLDNAISVQASYVKFLKGYKGIRDFSYGENIYSALSHLTDLKNRHSDFCKDDYPERELLRITEEEYLKNPKSIWAMRYLVAKKRFAKFVLKNAQSGDNCLEAYNLYNSVYKEYEVICDEFEKRGIAIVGDTGITKPEDIYEGYTEALCGIGESLFKLAQDQNMQSKAVFYIQKSAGIKEELISQYDFFWAYKTIYKEYHLLFQMYMDIEAYNEAKSVLDKDYKVYCTLQQRRQLDGEQIRACVKNLIYTGDVARILNPSEAMNFYKMAMDNVEGFKIKGISFTEEEAMLRNRGLI